MVEGPPPKQATPLKHATPRTLRWHWTTVGNEEGEGEEEDLSAEFPDEVFYVTRIVSNSSATPTATAHAHALCNNGETTPPTTSEEMGMKHEEN